MQLVHPQCIQFIHYIFNLLSLHVRLVFVLVTILHVEANCRAVTSMPCDLLVIPPSIDSTYNKIDFINHGKIHSPLDVESTRLVAESRQLPK